MRSAILFLVFLPAWSLHLLAQKKVDRQYFIDLLNAGEYDKVFNTAVKMRQEVYGKNAVIDYFIAKSLCLDGHKQKSTYCFNCIISNFKLSGNKKDFIQKEINTCNAPPDAEQEVLVANPAPNFSYINNVSLPEASVGGKMGRVFNCFSKNQTINLTRMVSQDELESRLFSVNQKTDAVRKVRSIVNDTYKIDTSGRYVFVTQKKYALDSVAYAAKKLEDAYRFFVSYYGLRAPDKLLTVYILRNQTALRQTAQLVHGIQLPDPNIGYSNLSDLSLLGLGDAKHLGTLYHELFHLIIRTDLGDIPAFLDEGLASLYSVSKWDADKLVGSDRPWRLDELREARYAENNSSLKIPPLDRLINYNWSEFDGQETNNVCQVAVNYALSNFLMIYLQEKNLLQQMVTAFKNRPFVPADDSKPISNLQIFEEVVKDSINSFTAKFEAWFSTKYNFDLYKKASPASDPNYPTTLFGNAYILLDQVNKDVFKFKEPDTFKQLEQELKIMTDDYYSTSPDDENMNNASANTVQQSVPVNSTGTKKATALARLQEFIKKLQKLISDKMSKTAN